MKFTQEVLAEIVAKSSTFDERLANGYFVPYPNPDNSEINRRLDRWCEVAAKGNREQFQKLLMLQGLDFDSIKSGLGPVRLSDEVALPDWIDLLQDGLREAAIQRSESLRFLIPAEPWPFEQVVAPFVRAASDLLRSRAGSAYLGVIDQAHSSLERKLLYWLVNVCSGVLMLEFSIFRLKRQPALSGRRAEPLAASSSQIYRDFCGQMLGGGLVPLFHEYSGLARAVATLMKNWIDSAAEFLSRLASDRDSLAEAFQAGRDLGEVEELSAGLSDPHRSGRSVFALTFSTGLKLVYKPKSLETEEAYTRLVEWINRHDLSLDLKGLNVLSRPGYGWVEFAQHYAPASDAERARFYHRSGMLLCLFYLLGTTDVHSENLIAAGEHPLLIDAETLITPSLEENKPGEADGWAETVAARKLSTSVVQVGMLPWWRSFGDGQVQDLSALGGVGGEDVFATAWQGIATDNLRRQVVTGKALRNRNAPFAAEEPADPSRYVEEVVAGFREMYNLLLVQRDALLQSSSPLDELARSPMRLVFRDTSTYFSILKNSVDAALLRDGAERSIHLELLSRVLLVSDSNARFAPFLKAEKQAISDFDIPFFNTRPQSRAMHIGDDEIIKNCFTQAGYERVHDRLLGFGNQNLTEQISIIRGSFWTKVANQRSGMNRVETGHTASIGQPEPTSDTLLDEAIDIARLLQREAIEGTDGSFTWLSVISQPNTQNYRFAQLGPGLFDGLAGVALFLAALESVSAGAGFRQLAVGTLIPIRRTLNSCEKLLSKKNKSLLQNLTLGLTGLGSIVYALTRAGQLLQDEAPLEIARYAASLINTDFLASNASMDVFDGLAGAILGLLSLHELQSDPLALDAAIAVGDKILKCHGAAVNCSRPASLAGGVAAGFAHGPAGVAHALLRLYRATNEPRFLEIAQELMPVVHSAKEWDSLDVSWRGGAAGLGLTWLCNLAVLDKSRNPAAIELAVERCLSAPLCGPDQVYTGVAGRLDLLVEASQRTRSDARLLMLARKQAAWCINRAKRETGFRLHAHLPPGAFLPGFYEGLAGIGYEFLRLAYPGTLPSVLLWN